VVRRATFTDSAPRGDELLKWFNGDSDPVPETFLLSVEAAANQDSPPDDPWS